MFLDNSRSGTGLNYFYTARQALSAGRSQYAEDSKLEGSNIFGRSSNYMFGAVGLAGLNKMKNSLFRNKRNLGLRSDSKILSLDTFLHKNVQKGAFISGRKTPWGQKAALGYVLFGYDDPKDYVLNAAFVGGWAYLEGTNKATGLSRADYLTNKGLRTYKDISTQYNANKIEGLPKQFKVDKMGKAPDLSTPRSRVVDQYLKTKKRANNSIIKQGLGEDKLANALKKEKKLAGISTNSIAYKTQKATRMGIETELHTLRQGASRANSQVERIHRLLYPNTTRAVEKGLGALDNLKMGNFSKVGKMVGSKFKRFGAGALAVAPLLAMGASTILSKTFGALSQATDQLEYAQINDFGEGFVPLSSAAQSERQRALQAISNASLNARTFMGKEARFSG